MPATPAGTVALYRILVIGASAAIDPANVTDVRPSGLAVPPATVLQTIHAGMFRAAALNVNNTLAVAPFDTAEPNSTPGVISGLGTSSARFNITVPGRYMLCAGVSFAPTVALTMYCTIRKNAVNQAAAGIGYSVTGQWGQGPTVAKGIVCDPGDYLDVTWQTNNATVSPIQGGLAQSFATLDYLGPHA